jgi:hypothetical protein
VLRRTIQGGFLRRLTLVPLMLAVVTVAIAIHELVHDPRLPLEWRKGMNVTAYQPEAFASQTADDALRDLRATGTTHVSIVPNWYMESPSSSTVAPDPSKTPTDASVEHAITEARSLGFEVTLKPHVDVKDGTFRGEIQPEDRAAWFASYRGMIDGYADLAQRAGATGLCVGTELTTMAEDVVSFREVIAGARARFDGELSYAANRIEEAERIGFWEELDLIGIDAYMPLETPNPDDPTLDQLQEAWQPYVDRIEALHERTAKDVVFTELGYESQVGAAAEEPTGEVSQAAQAQAYEAAYRAWSEPDFEWFRGIYWWDWSAEGLNSETGDGSFRMAGKEAEGVIREWNGEGYELPPDVDRGELRTLDDFGS